MKLGMKVGPQPQSITDVQTACPDFVEVWYDCTRPDDYNNLFAFLQENRIETGLHFWGSLTGLYPTLAYEDPDVTGEFMMLMKKTIDVAARNRFSYVNIHPGTRAKVAINYQEETFSVLSKPSQLHSSIERFIKNAKRLKQYAEQRSVLLTVETVAPISKNHWITNAMEGRNKPFNAYELPIQAIFSAAKEDIAIANDFAHTAASCITDDAKKVWDFLLETTKTLAPKTKLIHIGFLVPPYNGTDFHDHFDNPLFQTSKAVPNNHQMIQLLKLFQNQNNVFSLAEPNGRHVENFRFAQKMLAAAGVRTP